MAEAEDVDVEVYGGGEVANVDSHMAEEPADCLRWLIGIVSWHEVDWSLCLGGEEEREECGE